MKIACFFYDFLCIIKTNLTLYFTHKMTIFSRVCSHYDIIVRSCTNGWYLFWYQSVLERVRTRTRTQWVSPSPDSDSTFVDSDSDSTSVDSDSSAVDSDSGLMDSDSDSDSTQVDSDSR